MAKNQSFSIKDTVYKLQLEGIQNENQLFAAGSLMSRSDYAFYCKPLWISICRLITLGKERKDRYRISLKDHHKVYDLQETYRYCSSTCLINSRAFSGRFQDERCSVLNPGKRKEIPRLFENRSLGSKKNMGNNCDLGLSGLEIQEKTENNVEVPIKEWMGPSNAIEN